MTSKAVLITGCSEGGIGHALAERFQARGYHVFATTRDVAKIGDLASLPNVTSIQLDVTDQAQIDATVKLVSRETDSLMYLINNAGRNHFMPVLDEDIAQCKRIFETNVWGSLAMIKVFSPFVIKAKGTIVNITSTSGHVNVPYMGIYAASKRSLEIISETLRLELQPFSVGVLSVVTGAVQTNGQTYFDDWKLPETSLYKPVEETISARTKGHDGYKRMNLKKYAGSVVDEICRGTTGKYWLGTSAAMVRYGAALMPTSLLDAGLMKGTGLDVMLKHGVDGTR